MMCQSAFSKTLIFPPYQLEEILVPHLHGGDRCSRAVKNTIRGSTLIPERNADHVTSAEPCMQNLLPFLVETKLSGTLPTGFISLHSDPSICLSSRYCQCLTSLLPKSFHQSALMRATHHLKCHSNKGSGVKVAVRYHHVESAGERHQGMCLCCFY